MVKYTDKSKIIYRKEFDGNKRPYIDIEISTGNGKWLPQRVKFDSGADVTLFGKLIADKLGIRKLENPLRKTLKTANKGEVEAYRHTLFFKVANVIYRAYVWFTPRHDLRDKELLGRPDLLNHLGVIMDTRSIYLYVE